MQPPKLTLKTVVAVAGGLLAARITYRVGRLAWNVLTSVPPAAHVAHNCIPPPDFKHGVMTEAATRAFVAAHCPDLMELVDAGKLVVLQPAALLADALEQQQQQRAQAGGADAATSPCSGLLAANSAAATDAQAPALSEGDIKELLSSPGLQKCVANPVPELLVLVGTCHVAKESAEDVVRVIKAMRPGRVALELCPGRMQAMLLNRFADALWDTELCPQRAAELEAATSSSLLQVLEATLRSRDHNVLQALMSGMYARLAAQLEVHVGGEFLAARQALIEQLKAAAAPRAGTADEGHGAGAGNGAAAVRDSSWSSQGSGAAAGSDTRSATAAAAASSQPDERQQRRGKEPWRDGPNWLQLSVAADRPIEQTLMGMWGALGPWQRVCILWDVASMLVWKVDESLLDAMLNEDILDTLLGELEQEYPQLVRPLLHDRNFVLAVNTYCAAQRTAGPVVAVVGKGHIGGMCYVVQQLVAFMAKTGGTPIRILQGSEGDSGGCGGEVDSECSEGGSE